MKSLMAASLLSLLVTHAPQARAWGPQGHRVVGAIADRLLSPAARGVVAQLLEHDLDKFGDASGRTTLEAVSVWADEIRSTSASHPLWHYDSLPVCGSAPLAAYCPDAQCNTEQLKRLIAVLADTRAGPRDRNAALKWVVHLVADIHQPLHAADNGDRGGNLVQVALAGVRTRGHRSLHGVWDNDFVRLALHARSRQRPPADIAALASEGRRLAAQVGQGSPDSWAIESNRLARTVAYTYAGFACDRAPGGIVVLDERYQQRAEAVVRERLMLAGVRLAALLDITLSPLGGERRLQ